MPAKRQEGFTILEILIALVVLAIGILGMAGLQSKSLYNNHSAQLRTKATSLAHDIAERMRANRRIALESAANYQINMGTTPAAPGTNCATNNCSGNELATFDKYQWWSAVSNELPVGEASVAVDINKHIATITIQWEDNHDRFHSGKIKPLVLEAQL